MARLQIQDTDLDIGGLEEKNSENVGICIIQEGAMLAKRKLFSNAASLLLNNANGSRQLAKYFCLGH